jgi:CRISPR-associated protein Cmr4
MAIRLMFVHALTSLHAGTGQGVGVIDLPIARERATDLPLVPGSSLKGCLREKYRGEVELFGEKEGDGKDRAGMLQISDARLLLLPIRCLGASFVWTTSPYVLRRLHRDAQSAGLAAGMPPIPDLADGDASVASGDSLVEVNGEKRLVLEELDFAVKVEATAWSQWLGERIFPNDADPSASDWQREFKKRFAIVDDKSFHHLARFSTEVNAHVSIDQDTGTVKTGGLWYQESLPAETVMISVLRTEARNGSPIDPDAKLKSILHEQSLQIGGKATTGQGMVRLVPVGGAQ